MVDTTAFTVGEDLAVTPGAVVLRTELFELIQYEPSTTKVRETPLLLVPPMINKFYIADVAPGRSMLEYFVGAGPAVLHDLVAQPRRAPRRVGARRLRRPRCSRRSRRSRRSPAPTKSHVMGLCAGGITASCAVGHLGGDRRARPDRRADARRLRARQRERRDDRRARRRPDGRGRGRRVPAQGLPRRPRARGRVRVAAPQRPGLELLGQQLPAGQGPAGLRRPLLERRLDEPARRRCTATSWSSRSPTTLVRPGERDGAGHADRPLADHGRLLPVWPASPTTSRRGRATTARRSCSAPSRASCSPPAGTSPRSSTRRATRRPATR